MKTLLIIAISGLLFISSCKQKKNQSVKSENSLEFAKEMVEFVPYGHNPLFSGTNAETWDKFIRERGFILFDDGIYKMWYTGYTVDDNNPKYLGYATSDDGIKWTRYPKNPIFDQKWTEDMFVMKYEGMYYMYAEGKNDVAHMLESANGIDWKEQGDLIILTEKGDTIPGPYGTPSVLIENGKWYLFYERNDEAIWLATSKDKISWTNVHDEPVLKKGPGSYDSGALAANQVIKYKNMYYMYYHGSTDANWNTPGATSLWTSNVAISADLVNWIKYPGNPIVEGDHSSPILVPDGNKFRLYTMHNEVWLYYSK
jgi:beta-1,2-mannobiose phosphorylase / 1,2-beta-oligomannan phosphorylase